MLAALHARNYVHNHDLVALHPYVDIMSCNAMLKMLRAEETSKLPHIDYALSLQLAEMAPADSYILHS